MCCLRAIDQPRGDGSTCYRLRPKQQSRIDIRQCCGARTTSAARGRALHKAYPNNGRSRSEVPETRGGATYFNRSGDLRGRCAGRLSAGRGVTGCVTTSGKHSVPVSGASSFYPASTQFRILTKINRDQQHGRYFNIERGSISRLVIFGKVSPWRALHCLTGPPVSRHDRQKLHGVQVAHILLCLR